MLIIYKALGFYLIVNRFQIKMAPTTATLEEYMQTICNRFVKSVPQMNNNKLEKISDYNLTIPTLETIHILTQYNYNKEQLKQIAKNYKLRVTGNKREIMLRIYCFLQLSTVSIKLQKVYRGHIQRRYNKLHGPAFFNRSLCTNETDFFTMEELKDLPTHQFFSYKDADGFVYGFDLISLYNLMKRTNMDNTQNHSNKKVQNPYNRMEISIEILNHMKKIIKLGKVLKYHIDIEIKDESAEITPEKNIELRILDVFQNIDALGNYSSPEWFSSLNRNMLFRFMRELLEIWNYRAQLSSETKRMICPPTGDPFRNIMMNRIHTDPNMDNVKKMIIDVLEKLVNSGVDHDSKSLGAYYVLGALTLVNENAASSLPWLYQSFAYI